MSQPLRPDQPDTPPLTPQRRAAIRAMARTFGMELNWRKEGDKWLCQVDGMAPSFEAADAAITVHLGSVLPRFAVKQPGGGWDRRTLRWRVTIWANAPFDEYMRRDALPNKPVVN